MASEGVIEWTDATLGRRCVKERDLKNAARRAGLDLREYVDRLNRGLLHCGRCRDWHKAEEFGLDRTRYTGRNSSCRRSITIARGRDPDRPVSAVAEAAFRARIEELGATLLEPEWLGSIRPHRLLCAAGHECSQRPNRVLGRGLGICRICARQDPATAEAEFRARLAVAGAELLEPYINSQVPHRVRCAEGHECRPRPSGIQGGHGVCRTCSGYDPAVAEAAFHARLAELGAVSLESEWTGRHSPHRVRCALGHETSPYPGNVQRSGNICRVCDGRDPATAGAAFRIRLTELGAELLEPYTNSATPHRVLCAAGHECFPRPNGVRRGQGICRVCAGKTWDVFYVVTTAGAERLKFGVTSGDPRPRLSDHRAAGYASVTRLLTNLPGDTAPEIERAALAALRLADVKPIRGREYYDGSALALVLDITDNYIPHGGDAAKAREIRQAFRELTGTAP
jgi:hypothetical protein